MAVEYRDYYRTLGVSRQASAEEIRKAFRKLARETHPDVAGNQPNAESRFKEINEAYEVLGDPDKRRKYDALGSHWQPGAEFRPPPGWASTWTGKSAAGQGHNFEFQFGHTGFSDFFEQLFGSMAGAGFDPGRRTGYSEKPFGERGTDIESELVVSLHEVVHGSARRLTLQRSVSCQQCYGTGKVNSEICPACRGSGEIMQREKRQVRIPPGIREGQRLRLSGQGERGTAQAPAGDLLLRVRYAKHPDFQVQGDHLVHELAIAPWDAVLGANVVAPALESNISIKIPAGAQNGQRLRVRGHGLPLQNGERGDLHIAIKIQLPQKLTERERALWVQLAAESKLNARENTALGS
jgi:curved DNA-binding protein